MGEDVVSIQVKRGTKVEVQEVDDLDNDRVFIAEAPKNLKLAIKRVDPGDVAGAASIVTLCG